MLSNIYLKGGIKINQKNDLKKGISILKNSIYNNYIESIRHSIPKSYSQIYLYNAIVVTYNN